MARAKLQGSERKGSGDRCTAMDDDYRGFKSRPSLRLLSAFCFQWFRMWDLRGGI